MMEAAASGFRGQDAAAADKTPPPPVAWPAARAGLSRAVALHHRPSTSYQGSLRYSVALCYLYICYLYIPEAAMRLDPKPEIHTEG